MTRQILVQRSQYRHMGHDTWSYVMSPMLALSAPEKKLDVCDYNIMY